MIRKHCDQGNLLTPKTSLRLKHTKIRYKSPAMFDLHSMDMQGLLIIINVILFQLLKPTTNLLDLNAKQLIQGCIVIRIRLISAGDFYIEARPIIFPDFCSIDGVLDLRVA